jgi:threonine/homoserine/homoserine lactone efflux protein
MSILLPFISGFLAAIVGVFPPGLINMTAAKVSITDGRKRAMIFVLGAILVIIIQTYISVLFARYINQDESLVVLLREIGLGIFIVISVYFLFFAKKPKPKIKHENMQLKSKRSRFFMGMLISAVNFFPIPYYVLVSITLASYNIFTFEITAILSLVLGVVLGSLSIFYCYVVLFEKMKTKTDYFVKNMNTIIGLITGIIAIVTLINVVNYHLG